MSNQGTNIPVITSLVLDAEPPDPRRRKPADLWKGPFLEILHLFRILNISEPILNVDGLRFCFQPSYDFSRISRIYISVSTSSVRGEIDLMRIPLQGSNIVLERAVLQLQAYASRVLQRVQRFRDHLIERDAIENPIGFSRVDLFTCPLCRSRLVSCVDCDTIVACSNDDCPGSLLIECEFCYEHGRMSCRTCLTNQQIPSLFFCEVCEHWRCLADTFWCPGDVKEPAPGTEERARLSNESNWGSKTIVRTHPPKPSPCHYCLATTVIWASCRNCVDIVSPHRCPFQTPSLTHLGLRGASCPECVAQGLGYSCACCRTWLCETCFAYANKSRDYPLLITCPRCSTHFCTDEDSPCSEYIEVCRGCKGTILCADCHEEAELPGDTRPTKDRPKTVVFTQKCSYCEAWTCGKCRVSTRSATCFFCEEWFCNGCIRDQVHIVIRQCPVCNEWVCVDCTTEHEACPGNHLLNMRRREGSDES